MSGAATHVGRLVQQLDVVLGRPPFQSTDELLATAESLLTAINTTDVSLMEHDKDVTFTFPVIATSLTLGFSASSSGVTSATAVMRLICLAIARVSSICSYPLSQLLADTLTHFRFLPEVVVLHDACNNLTETTVRRFLGHPEVPSVSTSPQQAKKKPSGKPASKNVTDSSKLAISSATTTSSGPSAVSAHKDPVVATAVSMTESTCPQQPCGDVVLALCRAKHLVTPACRALVYQQVENATKFSGVCNGDVGRARDVLCAFGSQLVQHLKPLTLLTYLTHETAPFVLKSIQGHQSTSSAVLLLRDDSWICTALSQFYLSQASFVAVLKALHDEGQRADVDSTLCCAVLLALVLRLRYLRTQLNGASDALEDHCDDALLLVEALKAALGWSEYLQAHGASLVKWLVPLTVIVDSTSCLQPKCLPLCEASLLWGRLSCLCCTALRSCQQQQLPTAKSSSKPLTKTPHKNNNKGIAAFEEPVDSETVLILVASVAVSWTRIAAEADQLLSDTNTNTNTTELLKDFAAVTASVVGCSTPKLSVAAGVLDVVGSVVISSLVNQKQSFSDAMRFFTTGSCRDSVISSIKTFSASATGDYLPVFVGPLLAANDISFSDKLPFLEVVLSFLLDSSQSESLRSSALACVKSVASTELLWRSTLAWCAAHAKASISAVVLALDQLVTKRSELESVASEFKSLLQRVWDKMKEDELTEKLKHEQKTIEEKWKLFEEDNKKKAKCDVEKSNLDAARERARQRYMQRSAEAQRKLDEQAAKRRTEAQERARSAATRLAELEAQVKSVKHLTSDKRAQEVEAYRDRAVRSRDLVEYLKSLHFPEARALQIAGRLHQHLLRLDRNQVLEFVVTGNTTLPADLPLVDNEEPNVVSFSDELIPPAPDATNKGFWSAVLSGADVEIGGAGVHSAAGCEDVRAAHSLHFRLSALLDLFDYSTFDHDAFLDSDAWDDVCATAMLTTRAVRAVLDEHVGAHDASAAQCAGFDDAMHLVCEAQKRGLVIVNGGTVQLTPLGAAYHAPFWRSAKVMKAILERKRMQVQLLLAAAASVSNEEMEADTSCEEDDENSTQSPAAAGNCVTFTDELI